jgi:hypothetical protein
LNGSTSPGFAQTGGSASTSYYLESESFTASTFDGIGDERGNVQGNAHLHILNDDGIWGYQVDYSLPTNPDEYGYAGLVFDFSSPNDLSEFRFVEVTISYTDADVLCYMNFEDIAQERGYVVLDEDNLPVGSSVTRLNAQDMIIQIPLQGNFGAVNFDVIKKIGFTADTAYTRGAHTFIIRSVRFLP